MHPLQQPLLLRWMMLLIVLLLTLVAPPCRATEDTTTSTATTAASYDAGTATAAVVPLGKANFKSAIQDPANSFWLLKFYAPWYVVEISFVCVCEHTGVCVSAGKLLLYW